jgi:hypothetical protein
VREAEERESPFVSFLIVLSWCWVLGADVLFNLRPTVYFVQTVIFVQTGA